MKTLKVILTVFLVFGTVIAANGQKPESSSKIKSITILEEKSDMLIKKQYKESETFYDSKGNILEEISYKQGKVAKHFKYQYDAENNKIKEEEFDLSGKLIELSEYKFENGLRTEKIVYDGNKKMKSKKTYVYTTF
jgi:hypothetical protein